MQAMRALAILLVSKESPMAQPADLMGGISRGWNLLLVSHTLAPAPRV